MNVFTLYASLTLDDTPYNQAMARVAQNTGSMAAGVIKAAKGMSDTKARLLKKLAGESDVYLKTQGYLMGRNFVRSMGEALIAEQGALLAQAHALAQRIRAAFVEGSPGFASQNIAQTFARQAGFFKDGLERVPYDNFPAILHKDEMVLTAKQAHSYRQNDDCENEKNNVVVHQYFYGVKEEQTAYKAYRALKNNLNDWSEVT